jgi:hypothetical protein
LKFWELRQQANKRIQALDFVEEGSKERFLQWDEPKILDFKISAYEPTEVESQLNVVMSTHISTPWGTVERVVTEPWVLANGEWFRRIDPLDMVSDLKKEAPPKEQPHPPAVEFATKNVDAGSHVQGERIEGRIPLRGEHADIRSILPNAITPGLVFSQPVWTSKTEGYLPYTWETALMSQSVRQSLRFEIKGLNDSVTSTEIQFSVKIDPRMSFRQIPEIVDMAEAGLVELELKNLGKKPQQILSLVSSNPAFVPDDPKEDTMHPGETIRLQVHYRAAQSPRGASLDIMFSDPFTESPLTRVPIKVQLPKPSAAVPDITEEMRRRAEEEFRKQQGNTPR